jgi:uncharacterized protein (UPF0305 family)
LDSSFVNKDEKEEKIEALDSWMESTEEELEFAESIYKIVDSSTTKEEFLRLAKAKLREYKNPWIEDKKLLSTMKMFLNIYSTNIKE